MIPDSLFSPPQSPVFFLLQVPFSSSRKPCFSLFKVFVSFCSESRFLHSPSPVPVLFRPLSSSSLSSSVLSKSSPLLFSKSSPILLASKNSGTTRSRPAVRVVRSKMEHSYSVGCSLIISSSCCFLISSASSMLMSFQLFGESLDDSQISSEKTLFCNSTSALCVSRHPAFGLRMRTFTCFTFVSIFYAIV